MLCQLAVTAGATWRARAHAHVHTHCAGSGGREVNFLFVGSVYGMCSSTAERPHSSAAGRARGSAAELAVPPCAVYVGLTDQVGAAGD